MTAMWDVRGMTINGCDVRVVGPGKTLGAPDLSVQSLCPPYHSKTAQLVDNMILKDAYPIKILFSCSPNAIVTTVIYGKS